jgi:hypothetical protein
MQNEECHYYEAWHLHSVEKIKDSKVRCAVLDCLHMVMFMSINPNDDFKTHGKEVVVESFDNLQPIVT